ncbi:hypothetical protein GDO81_020727 [Engystomops pustulosus]|uniref:Uncharacterized protein n=1 Tax=Engystomops pustulosus TaxID=76066 RepID=A0AAV6YR70_ENGPU|nr:hypothetical protein GDO81_020727 [Engystomops pustulosus]
MRRTQRFGPQCTSLSRANTRTGHLADRWLWRKHQDRPLGRSLITHLLWQILDFPEDLGGPASAGRRSWGVAQCLWGGGHGWGGGGRSWVGGPSVCGDGVRI